MLEDVARGADAAPDGSLPVGPTDAQAVSSPAGSRARLLSTLVALQVLAQVAHLTGLVLAGLLGTTTVGSLLAALDTSPWVRAALAAGLLLLMILAVAGLLRRTGAGGPGRWMALGAALAAQAFLAARSVSEITQRGVSAAEAPVRPPSDPAWLDPAIGVLVFLLTFGAWVADRRGDTTGAVGRGAPTAGRNVGRALRASLGVAAVLVVAGGSLASASRPDSSVACVDVTRAAGIQFRGALGNAVVDGSDKSVQMQQNIGNGVAVGDYDQDGNLDLYLLGQPGHPNRLYRNDHTASHDGFTDVTDAAGLGGFTGSRAAQFVDLDNDGLQDLVAVNDSSPGTALQPSRIYRNAGSGSFVDVTSGSGFDPEGVVVGGLGIADYNHDGLPDLFVAYWAGGMELGASYGSHNRLFQNLGNFRFKDVTEQAGLGTLSTGTFTPIFADLNADGWPDLYLAIDGASERLFINDRGTFRDATTESGLGTTRNGMGAALVDPEGLGIPSIYVTNITEPDHKLGTPPGGDALLRPRLRPGGGVGYVDDAAGAGVRDAGWAWGPAFTDLNLDGHPDLYVAQGFRVATRGVSAALTNDRAHVFVGTGAGTFVSSTGNGCDIPGDQRAVVALDYNRDGRPDLLVSQVLYDFVLLENRTEPAGHWLTVVAQPTTGRTVVGAKVTVTAGGRRWTQTLLGGGGYLSGPPNEAYFGLGTIDRVASVTVDWPDGTATERSDVTADRLLLMPPP